VGEEVVWFGSTLKDAGFDSVAPHRIDLQVAQARAGPCVGQSAKRVREADALDCNFLVYSSRVHNCTNQVVDQSEDGKFLENTGNCLTMQDIHLHGLLEMTEIGFDLPALTVKIGQGLGGILLRVEERCNQRDFPGSTAALLDSVAPFPKGQRSRQGGKLFRGHPRGTVCVFEILDHLVPYTQMPQPTGAGQTFAVWSAPRPVTGTAGPKIDNQLLMGAEHAMQFTAEQQSKMNVGAEPAIADQDVAFFQFGMEIGDLAHVMRSQRGCQNLEEETSARVKESQQMRNGKAATRPLVSGLAEFPLEFGSIGHAETRAVDMEGAMSVPAAVAVHRGAKGSSDTLQQCLQNLQRESASGPAIGRLAENPVGEVLEPGDGEVAVEDLDNKEVNRGDRIQDAPTKLVASFAA
jgi:hypothetical protein